jgi:branched-chain amino acid transport system substrate-binding protein
MSVSGKRTPPARWVGALLLVPALGVLGACGSSATSASSAAAAATATAAAAAAAAGGGGGGGLPASLQIPAIQDLTGPAGFAGTDTQQGQRVAVEQINSTHFLGSTTLSLTYSDTQSTPQIAAEAASSDVKSNAPLAFGPVLSTVSLAAGPIVQRGGLPTIFTQSTSAGVNVGDETYTATAPVTVFLDATLGQYLKTKNVKSLGIIGNTDNPEALATAQGLRDFCAQNGIQTISSNNVPTTTTDFTAIATKIVDARPTAVFLLLVGTQNVTAIKQLRADGYNGMIVGTDSIGGSSVLTPLGKSANGIVYATDYTAGLPGAVNKAFTSLYAKMYGAGQPSDFTAEGYDAVWFAARALKLADSTNRSKVLAALQSVAKTGFEGAVGKVTFENRIEQVPGVLVEWENGKETLLTTP